MRSQPPSRVIAVLGVVAGISAALFANKRRSREARFASVPVKSATWLPKYGPQVLVGLVTQVIVVLLTAAIGLVEKYGGVGLIVFSCGMTVACLVVAFMFATAAMDKVSNFFAVLATINSIVFLGTVLVGVFQSM
ncbi:hypothetical protein ACWGE0_34415 [Lentzea sp. NPDC054927]